MNNIMTVVAGDAAIRQIVLAYRANLPVLLHGRHGVGKSELIRQAASQLGIHIIVRDLSLLEPPDLIGIPRIESDGMTHYAPPSFLPTKGAGLLVFEELNRAPRYVVAPCLQLLTARCLNDYVLPKGWVPCGAVNDVEDGYQVESLDPALLSRFVRVKLEPDAATWSAWARASGLDHRVISFVENTPEIFYGPQSNPRSWTYVSRVLSAAGSDSSADDLTVAIAGLVGETWAGAFVAQLGSDTPLTAIEIIEAYSTRASSARRWRDTGRVDLLKASWLNLRNYLQRQANYDLLLATPVSKKNAEEFLASLAPDLRVQARDWLKERGMTGISVAKKG